MREQARRAKTRERASAAAAARIGTFGSRSPARCPQARSSSRDRALPTGGRRRAADAVFFFLWVGDAYRGSKEAACPYQVGSELALLRLQSDIPGLHTTYVSRRTTEHAFAMNIEYSDMIHEESP